MRDERSRKQMSVVTAQLGREDVAVVVNACDAGREGELIFAYLYEKAKGKKPVKRLWLNSMTNAAMKSALRVAAPRRGATPARAGRPLALGGRLDRRHERHPRGDDPPAQLVRRRGLAGARADADARDRGAPRGGDQSVRARALLARGRDVRGRSARRRARCWDEAGTARNGTGDDGERVYEGRFHAGAKPRIASEAEALAIVEACEGKQGTITKLEKKEQREKAPMLYDLTTLQREANTRYGFSAQTHAGGGAALLRGAQGAHLSRARTRAT